MSILVAEHINSVLSSSQELNKKLKGRIFLEGLRNDTEFPYIIYDYSISPNFDNSSKDGDCDLCDVVIGIFSDEPLQSLEIANDIRNILTNADGSYNSFFVENTEFAGFEGSFEDGCYIRILKFNIYTSKK